MNVKEALEKRRAYRSLDPIDIDDELIRDFAETVKITPSCVNKQPWRLIFVKDKAQLNRLFEILSKGNKWAEKASMIIAVFSKPENDCIIGERLYYLFDTGMATAFLILRATELGLVAHPIAGFKETQAKEILEIPDGMRLITLVIIGKHSKDVNPVLSDAMKLGEKFIEKKSLKVILLSDVDKKIIKEYGKWAKKKFRGKEYMGVVRSTFLINPNGKIAHIWPKVSVNGHPEDVQKVLTKIRK